jgi:hypothetical protein
MRLNFSALPDDEIRMMVSTTAMNVYGFDAEALRPVADRIGPTLEEIKTPISIADIGVDKQTHCPTFIEAAMAG